MDKANLPDAQQNIVDYLARHGELETAHVKLRGLDLRAANKLVKVGIVTLTDGVFRLKHRKKSAKEEPKAPVEQVAEPVAQAPEPAAIPVPQPETTESFAVGVDGAEADGTNDPTGETDDIKGTEWEESAEPVAITEPEQPVAEPVAAPKEEPNEPAPIQEAAKEEAKAPAQPAEKAETAPKAKEAAKEKPKKKGRKAKVERPVINPSGKCLCGCGAEIGGMRRFAIGHDAKLHSLVLRVFRNKANVKDLPDSAETMDYLRSAPWMTDEIREAIGL